MNNLTQISKSIRKLVLESINKANSSHIGSVFSCVDILTVLYFGVMNINRKNTKMKTRDRFILSKGHAGVGIYAILQKKYFFKKDLLKTYGQNGSLLSGHVSNKNINGVEFSTGSLGHGLPVACGYAVAMKFDKNTKSRVFCLLSDGELNEGSNWEAILFANHHKLNNLVAIIDRNKLQSIKSTEKTLRLEPLKKKISAFGWTVKVCDGHDHIKMRSILRKKYSNPLFLIANTVKGKGVSFMEGNNLWHYKTPKNHDYEKALSELN